MNTIIRARFEGTDGSLGYRTGTVYTLVVRDDGRRPTIVSPRACPYESWRAFWRNWEVLS